MFDIRVFLRDHTEKSYCTVFLFLVSINMETSIFLTTVVSMDSADNRCLWPETWCRCSVSSPIDSLSTCRAASSCPSGGMFWKISGLVLFSLVSQCRRRPNVCATSSARTMTCPRPRSSPRWTLCSGRETSWSGRSRPGGLRPLCLTQPMSSSSVWHECPYKQLWWKCLCLF